MALCHLAHNTGTSEWPSVLPVSHHELLCKTGLTAHKWKAILFTAISRLIDCLQPVTVLVTLRGQAPKVLYVFFDVSKKGWSDEHPCTFFLSNIIGLDLGVTVSELLTVFYNMLCMNMSTTSRNFWKKRNSTHRNCIWRWIKWFAILFFFFFWGGGGGGRQVYHCRLIDTFFSLSYWPVNMSTLFPLGLELLYSLLKVYILKINLESIKAANI